MTYLVMILLGVNFSLVQQCVLPFAFLRVGEKFNGNEPNLGTFPPEFLFDLSALTM